MSNLESAENYRDRQLANTDSYIYRRLSNGKILYVLVSDSAATKAQAENVRANYRKFALKENPWIKSVSAVHNEINAFDEANGR